MSNLQAQLDERKANWASKASDHIKKIYDEGIQDIIDRDILGGVPKVGQKVPDFSLTNAVGNKISLYSELKNGPVVLTWYRGGWCPYCNITLHYLQEKLPEFKALGASLIALTPELPDKSLSTKEKYDLTFEVLSDVDNNVARDFGLVFKLTNDVAEAYEKAFGLTDYNGSDSGELPLAATFVIDQEANIKYVFADADYRNRAEPSDLLEALKGL